MKMIVLLGASSSHLSLTAITTEKLLLSGTAQSDSSNRSTSAAPTHDPIPRKTYSATRP